MARHLPRMAGDPFVAAADATGMLRFVLIY